MMSINYSYWLNMELWELHEGIYLLLGREPDLSEFLRREQNRYGDGVFWSKFDQIAEMAKRSIMTGNLKFYSSPPERLFCKLIPSVFLLWAKNKNLDISDEFNCLLNNQEDLSKMKEGTNPLATKEDGSKVPDNFRGRPTHDEKTTIYNSIHLTDERRQLLIKKIPSETTELRKRRIFEDTKFYKTELEKKYSKFKISVEQTVKMLHRLEAPIYLSLNSDPLKAATYVTYEREIRNHG